MEPPPSFTSKKKAKLYIAEQSVIDKKPFRVGRSDSRRFEVFCPVAGCLFNTSIRARKNDFFYRCFQNIWPDFSKYTGLLDPGIPKNKTADFKNCEMKSGYLINKEPANYPSIFKAPPPPKLPILLAGIRNVGKSSVHWVFFLEEDAGRGADLQTYDAYPLDQSVCRGLTQRG